MSLFYRVRRQLARRFFSAGYRLRFYRILALQMKNGVQLLAALEQISNMYTDFGRRQHGFGYLVDDCRAALSDNSDEHSLEHALARWVPAEEAALISAGMFSGRLPEALAQAEILIDCRRRIRNAVLRMSIYPAGCVAMLAGTLLVIQEKLIPTLAGMSEPETWTGALGDSTTRCGFSSSTAWCQGDLSRGCGMGYVVTATLATSGPQAPGRQTRALGGLQRYSGGDFSYQHRSTAEFRGKTLDALQVMHRFASPWLAVRLDAVMMEVEEGASFGVALRDCGYNFPSKEAVNYLSMVSGDGAAQMITRFGQEWLEETVERVNRRGIAVMLFSMVMLFALLAVVVMAVMEVTSMTESMGQY